VGENRVVVVKFIMSAACVYASAHCSLGNEGCGELKGYFGWVRVSVLFVIVYDQNETNVYLAMECGRLNHFSAPLFTLTLRTFRHRAAAVKNTRNRNPPTFDPE